MLWLWVWQMGRQGLSTEHGRRWGLAEYLWNGNGICQPKEPKCRLYGTWKSHLGKMLGRGRHTMLHWIDLPWSSHSLTIYYGNRQSIWSEREPNACQPQ